MQAKIIGPSKINMPAILRKTDRGSTIELKNLISAIIPTKLMTNPWDREV
jgi:hypothetical protein